MKMHPVKFSKIDVIGYDEQTHKLRVSFRKGKPREFCHVIGQGNVLTSLVADLL
jgi:hypothetical protein